MPITASTGLISVPSVGVPFVLTSAHLYIQDHSANNPAPDANLLVTVTAPPAHGTLRLSGTPIAQFTNADLLGGLVTYTSTDGADDNFTVFVRATTTPYVAKPYTPQFTYYSPSNPGGDGAIYMTACLVGSGSPPVLTIIDAYQGGSGVGTTLTTPTFVVTTGTQVVVVAAFTEVSAGTGAVSVTSISCGSLTLTHIGGGSVNTSAPPGFPTVNNTIDWYWAPVPSGLWGTSISMSATFSGSIPFSNMFLGIHGFRNVANPAAPWDTNASNLQSSVATTLPTTGYLTADASDTVVLPIFFELVGGANIQGGGSYPLQPDVMGYDNLQYEGGTLGVTTAWMRASATASPHVHVTGVVIPTETLIDAELFFTPTAGFIDFANAANRRLFVSAGNGAEFLGTDGARPFGTAPSVYLTAVTGNPNAFAQNNGMAGPFAINGRIDAFTPAPGCTPYVVPEAAGPAAAPQWRLTVSDDGGRTWSTLVKPRDIGETGKYRTRLRWLKMGQFRQRTVRLECSDPVRRNIVGIYEDNTPGMS